MPDIFSSYATAHPISACRYAASRAPARLIVWRACRMPLERKMWRYAYMLLDDAV